MTLTTTRSRAPPTVGGLGRFRSIRKGAQCNSPTRVLMGRGPGCRLISSQLCPFLQLQPVGPTSPHFGLSAKLRADTRRMRECLRTLARADPDRAAGAIQEQEARACTQSEGGDRRWSAANPSRRSRTEGGGSPGVATLVVVHAMRVLHPQASGSMSPTAGILNRSRGESSCDAHAHVHGHMGPGSPMQGMTWPCGEELHPTLSTMPCMTPRFPISYHGSCLT